MSQLQLKAKTAWALGFMSLFRVLKYRLSVRIGLNSVQKLTAQLPRGNFFASPRPNEESGATVTDIPNWFYNRFSHRQFKDTHLPWYQIPDFDEQMSIYHHQFLRTLGSQQPKVEPTRTLQDSSHDRFSHEERPSRHLRSSPCLHQRIRCHRFQHQRV